MTIREYLMRRRYKAVLLVLPGVAFCVLSAVIVPDSFWLNWLSLAALFAGLVAVIMLLYRTPCSLGSIAARAANGWAKTGHCPGCRISLDEPMGSAADRAPRLCRICGINYLRIVRVGIFARRLGWVVTSQCQFQSRGCG
jgi:hypothetical protein